MLFSKPRYYLRLFLIHLLKISQNWLLLVHGFEISFLTVPKIIWLTETAKNALIVSYLMQIYLKLISQKTKNLKLGFNFVKI